MKPPSAVAALDRILLSVQRYERMWEANRDPQRLWRTPWEDAGKDLAEDLNRLSDLREFLQAARTLLAEHTGAAR